MIGANTSMPMLTMVPLNSAVGDADDGERLAVEVERLAEIAGIGGERSAPQRVADDGHRMLPRRHIVRRQQRAAELRADAERLEVIAGDELGDHAFGVGAAPDAREDHRSTRVSVSNA